MKYPFGKPIFDTKKYIEDIKNIMEIETGSWSKYR